MNPLNKEKLKRILTYDNIAYAVLVLFTVFICFMSTCSPFTKASLWGDSAAYYYSGYCTARGLTPYVDVVYGQQPFMRLINTLAALTIGKAGVWLFELVFTFIAMLFAYKACKLFFNKFVSLLSTVAVFSLLAEYLQEGNFTEEFALPFLMIGLYYILKIFKSEDFTLTKLQLIGIGATCGAAFMFKANMVVMYLILAVMIAVKLFRLKRGMDVLKYLGFALIGFAAITVPVFIYLIVIGGFGIFISGLFGLSGYVAYAASIGNILGALRYFIVSAWQFHVICLAAVFLKVAFNKNKNESRYFWLTLVVYWAVSILAISIAGNAYEHYAMQNLPTFVIPTAWAIDAVLSLVKEREICVRIITGVLCLSVIAGVGIFKIASNDLKKFKAHEYRETADIVQKYSGYNDRIIVLGYDSWLYCQAERLSASRYYYQLANAMREDDFKVFIDEVKESKPKVIVDKTDDASYSGIREALDDFINTYYEEVEENIYVLK